MKSDPHTTTIAAIATPPGTGAISMIRVSGPQALEVAALATGRDISSANPNTLHHVRILDEGGNPIDDGLMAVFRAPRSFTGENTVEFTGHGGPLVTRETLDRFLKCGAVHAGPGEFSHRAFLNGKLDLTQAEGIMDVISAQTRLSLRAARSQLDGAIGKRTTMARDALLDVLAHLEAWIDFPDEDIDPATGAALIAKTRAVLDSTEALLATADQGRILREGVRTVIYGPPNVGKSSLLNQLLGFDRAIVSHIPGTTRDTIEETINLRGIPLRLIDTAGIRDSDDAIEAAGIQRTRSQAEAADLILTLADASQPKSAHNEAPDLPDAQHLFILNKTDLGEHPSWSGTDAIRISCESGDGLDTLSEAIRELLHLGTADWGEHAVAINARHQAALDSARTSLHAALALLETQELDPAIVAIELRSAIDSLSEIPGKLDTEDLLGKIFANFCIGK